MKGGHEHDENADIEQYLREFQPRAVRRLEFERTASRMKWRRLAAAAVVLLALGTSVWLAQLNSGKAHTSTQEETQGAHGQQGELNNLQLTRLALDDEEKFNEVLAERSRRILPPMNGERNSLRLLAKE